MHFFTILFLLGEIVRQSAEGAHLYPHKLCNWDGHLNQIRIKRSRPSNQLDSNLELDDLIAGSSGINNPSKAPHHLWDVKNHRDAARHAGSDTESEIVGLGGLLTVRALAARAKARATVARASARARFHRPLLLESTPEEFLHENGAKMKVSQNNFLVSDAGVSSKQNFRHNGDQQGNNPAAHFSIQQNFDLEKPAQQTTAPLQVENIKNPYHESTFHLPPIGLGMATSNKQRPHTAFQTSTKANNLENQPIIRDDKTTPPVAFPNFEVVVPTTSPNLARSAENYEHGQFHPPPLSEFRMPPIIYNPQPEIRVHNIDNSEEVYRNQKPGFSIIPTNWKPPPDSNLYVQREYEETDGQEPILAVLPGKWTHDGGYDTYYYEDYDVVPIAYNIPDEITPNYYGRSAEIDEVDEDAVPEQFVGIKKQFQNWEDNPMVWRPKSSTEEQQRVAEPSDKRHFHHGHSHTFIHKHVKPGFSSGFQSSSFIQPTGHANSGVSGFQSQSSNFAQPTGHVPVQHSGFFQSQNADFFEHQAPENSPFLDIHDQGHNPGYFHHGHSITINKQKTTVIAPSDFHKNIEIAQVTGNNNAVSQAQASSAAHQHGFDGNEFIPHNAKFQSAQVFGTQNAVSQSQRSAETAPAGMKSTGLLGAPYLINFPRRSESFWRTHNDAPQKLLKKRSVDNSIDLNDNRLDDYHKTSSKVSTNIVDLLKKQSELFKEIQQSPKDDKELLFLTELSSNLLDDVEESLKSHLITKRTVPILRLIADPNAKLDVPKTLENMGTVARNSFENKRAPMYHIKNLAGSAKDAFLSTLRIVPQDFLIPSRYKIIDREREGAEPSKLQNKNSRGDEEVKAISPSLLPRAKTLRERITERRKRPKEVPVQQPEAPREAEEDPYGFSGTFNKVGSMLRESIRSGQDALSHMGEIYHSTRKALATAQHSVPRVILSSMRIPAVQRHQPLLPQNDKIMMVTPKILQLKQEAVGAPHYSENMGDLVGIGNVMDSLGISRPDAGEVGQRRIVIHPANVGRAVAERRPMLPDLRARSNFVDDQERSVEDILRNDFVLSETDASEDNMRDTMVALGNSKGRARERPNLVERRPGLRARSNFADDEERSGKAVLRRYFVMADTLPTDTPEGNMRDALNNARERAVEKLKLAERRPDLRARSNFVEDQEQSVEDNLKRDSVMADTSQTRSSENIMGDTMDALDNAINAIGATSLRDFILHMKDGLSNIFKEKLEEARDRFSGRLGSPKTSLDYEGIKGKIAIESEGKRPATFKFKVKNPFSQDVEQESNLEGNNDGIKLASDEQAISKSSQNESVGAGLFLPKQLMTPFMGQPSKMERREFFEELGDREELIEEDKDEGQEEIPPPDDDSVTPSNQEQIGAINPILLNETFQLSDNRSSLEFLAALNASKHANRTSGSTKGNSEVWEHKCIYARTTTEESTTNVESTTMVNVEEASEATHLEIQHMTIMSAEEDEETTTKKIETVLETDVNSKNQNAQTDNVGRKMITNKALLTPFMGKPFEKETYAYFEPNENTYGEDSDEDLYYLGNPGYENPEQLQVLPTDDAGKKTKGSFRETAANQQNILGVPLEHNLL